MIYKSEDIKKMNSLLLLNQLYEIQSATMSELVKVTHLSQSSVRSILKSLESKGILTLDHMEQSNGGRCPGRYTFSVEHFQILSVFIDEGYVDIIQKDILQKESMKEHIKCELNEELEKHILDIVSKTSINCISIASSGVVQDDCFYTDHGEYMMKHAIACNLKQHLSIPIIIENDVKSMMMGIRCHQTCNSLAYLYMSDTGVGSAYYLHSDILKGHQSFSGELGMLPYLDHTINEVIACHPDDKTLEDIYVQILATIALTIDPEKIIISGKNLHRLSITRIKEHLHQCLSSRYQLNIDLSNDPLHDGLEGLHYMGILKLFDQYTDYEGVHYE